MPRESDSANFDARSADAIAHDLPFAARAEVRPTKVSITHEGPIIRVERLEFAPKQSFDGRATPAAVRDLEEETGYAAGTLVKLGAFFTSPGFADEIMHVFLATGLRPVPQRLEPGEELEVVEMRPDALATQIAAGRVTDGKTLGAYLLWSLHRAEGSSQ